MQDLIVVNACHLLMDEQVQKIVAPLQTQIDRDFLPAWGPRGAPAVRVSFASIADIPALSPDCWPIFLNLHSLDPGALGWHDDQAGQGTRIFSRVFVGDCIRLGLNWTVTVSHEMLEIMLDPDVRRVFRMSSGKLAALEACDAVESDDQAYAIDGVMVSNFVLPAYFGNGSGPYDFGGVLQGPCPSLSPGGYMSIQDDAGRWTQIYANRRDGLIGRRALMRGHRRTARQRWLRHQFEVWDDAGAS